jgi:hypothetical protein
MSEESVRKDPGSVWREQPEEKRPVNLEEFANSRTRELYSNTRGEILTSVGAGLFFVALISWRFARVHDRLPPLGWIGGMAAIAWAAITLYWFRDRIGRASAPRWDALAATGVEHYRKELARRRDHLRNAWLWHGPLFLACVVLTGVVAGRAFPGFDRLGNALPLFVLLAVWTGFGIRRRVRQANDVEREIAEMDAAQPGKS